jgi:hypothetical protein
MHGAVLSDYTCVDTFTEKKTDVKCRGYMVAPSNWQPTRSQQLHDLLRREISLTEGLLGHMKRFVRPGLRACRKLPQSPFMLRAHERIKTLVPTARLELAQLSPLPPQDSVSTNFTTSAFHEAVATTTFASGLEGSPLYRVVAHFRRPCAKKFSDGGEALKTPALS